MNWLFGGTAAATEASAAEAAAAAAAAAAPTVGVGGVGAGLTTLGASTPSLVATLGDAATAAVPSTIGGTFGGLGVGGTGLPLSGVGAGMGGLSLPGLGTMPTYGGLGAATAPSLLTGPGSFTGGVAGSLPSALMSNQIFQPTLAQRAQGAIAHLGSNPKDILDGLITGFTLAGPDAPLTAQGGGGIAPAPLPNQIQTLGPQANRGRMGISMNGIVSWIPQTPQVPQAPGLPGALPPVGPYRG